METEVKRKTILINPPPSDLRCEICGRDFQDLPYFSDYFETDIFNGHRVRDKNKKIKLFKTYRGSIQISASWECFDCLNTSTIDDVMDYFITDRPDNGYPYMDDIASDNMGKYLDRLKDLCIKAIEEDKIHFDTDESSFATGYWRNYFGL